MTNPEDPCGRDDCRACSATNNTTTWSNTGPYTITMPSGTYNAIPAHTCRILGPPPPAKITETRMDKVRRKWTDWVFTIGGISFSLALIPALLDSNARVPVWSSLLTGGWLLAYAFAFRAMRLNRSALSTLINGILWLAMAAWRQA